MSLLYGCNYLVDVLLYFGVLGCLGVLWNQSRQLFFIPFVLFAACALSHALSGKKKPWVRALPQALALPALLMAGGWGERLLCVAPCAYLFFYIRNNRGLTDYYYVARRFRGALIGMCFVLFLVLFNPAKSWTNGLVYLFLYFAFIIYLLRCLRHDDGTVRSARFKVMNLMSIGAVCAAGFALSQPRVVALLRALWRLFLDKILAPVASILLYIVELALYGVYSVIGMLLPDASLEGFGGMPGMQMSDSMDEFLERADPEQARVNPIARAIVIGIGAALLIAAMILIVRLLSRQTARMATANDDEEREALAEEEAAPRRPLFRRGENQGVRYYYRKSLQLLRARGGTVSRYMNTQQISEENAQKADADAMERLRGLYLPARYDDQPPSPEAIKAAREAYEAMRRSRPTPEG